ncbi:MAG: methyltransferase domain-containing protein [Candidatus Tectomicrobia bacterium]|nr:methyltransferase domain-containing protein [Candidatus Tectomicrobia bacterium]
MFHRLLARLGAREGGGEAGRARLPELIDQPLSSYPELYENLLDIRRYNRWLGGRRFLMRHLAPLLLAEPRRRWTILDLATGSADIPQHLAKWGARRGLRLTCIGLDANALVLRAARELLHGAARPTSSGLPAAGVRLLRADARALPLRDGSVDVVLCSQALHHFEDGEGRALLRSLARLARRAVIVEDLVRHWLPYRGVQAIVRATTRNRLTRADGPASVRNSFSPAEWRRLAAALAAEGYVLHRHFPYRAVLTLRRPPPPMGFAAEPVGTASSSQAGEQHAW